MHQDSKRTCTAIVLLIKPFVWCRSRRRRRRGLLRLPSVPQEATANTAGNPSERYPSPKGHQVDVSSDKIVSHTNC